MAQAVSRSDCAMTQAVSRSLATRKSGFDRRTVHVRIVGKVALGQMLLKVLRFPGVNIIFIYVQVAVTEG